MPSCARPDCRKHSESARRNKAAADRRRFKRSKEDVDGRVKPGHDGEGATRQTKTAGSSHPAALNSIRLFKPRLSSPASPAPACRPSSRSRA
jgi:hypothetical protein